MYVCVCVISLRKQDFRELKQLQREEMKEATEFYAKVKLDRDTQERKFELEVVVSVVAMKMALYTHAGHGQDIEKRYESERELLTKQQKKETDRQEHQHIQQFKAKLKQIKSQQVS